MALQDEIKQQQELVKDRSLKQKAQYFWDYYKVHVIIVVVVVCFLLSLIKSVTSHKEDVLHVCLFNTNNECLTDSVIAEWTAECEALLNIAADEEIIIEHMLQVSANPTDQYEMTTAQRILALSASDSLDVMSMDLETFEHYAQLAYFGDLRDILSEEEIRKYEPYFYYTDVSTIPQSESEEYSHEEASKLVIDHHDPNTMQQPVPIGIFLTTQNRIADNGCYDYLKESSFQGEQSEAVLGIVQGTDNPEGTRAFIDFMFNY